MKNAVTASILTLALLAGCGEPTTPETDAPAAAAPPVAEAADAPVVSALDAAIAGEHRTDAEKARDAWRNPKETLEFLGIAADHKVVELWPGGGWYTNILAPYLASGNGTLVAAGFDPAAFDDEERRARIETRNADFQANYSDPKFGNLEFTVFSGISGPLTEAGSADAVLTFRNIHNWMSGGYTEKFFSDAYAALKPGGTLGVIEHRLPSTQSQDPTASSGYVHEDYVKSLATAAGFTFVDSSEVNANPADTADHPFGVWTLPPNNRSTDREGNSVEGFDPAIYTAIGESDRMTLKFIKPSE